MTPGCTELTRMPSLAYCTAGDLAMPRPAPLDAHEPRLTARRRDLLGHLMPVGLEDVADDDPRALPREDRRFAPAHAAGTARDERHLAREPHTVASPVVLLTACTRIMITGLILFASRGISGCMCADRASSRALASQRRARRANDVHERGDVVFRRRIVEH